MNKNLKKKTKSNEAKTSGFVIAASLAYLVLGIIMVVWPRSIQNVLCYILGIVLTVYGLFNIINFFRNRESNLYFEMVVGVLAAAFGIFTLISPNSIINIVFTVIGIIVVIDSLMDVKHSFELKTLGMKYWWICFAVSAAVIILGICTILFTSFFGDFITILLGIIMIYEGVSGFAIILLKNHYSGVQKQGNHMIDVDATDRT